MAQHHSILTVSRKMESAGTFYAALVHGSENAAVDLPSAAKASGFAGVGQPKLNQTSYSADDIIDVMREGITPCLKSTGYTVDAGDVMVIYDDTGAIAPVGEVELESGSNVEAVGWAEEDAASDDVLCVLHIHHFSYQA